MAEQLSSFKQNLEMFARKHKKEINRDPEFRRHFQQMCASIGVDPLACKSPKIRVSSASGSLFPQSKTAGFEDSEQRILGGNSGRRRLLL